MPDPVLHAARAAPAAPSARRFRLLWHAAALLAAILVLAAAPAPASAEPPLDTPMAQGQRQAAQRPRPPRGVICVSLFLRDCTTPHAVRRSDDEEAEPPIGSVAFRLSRTAPNRSAARPGQPGAPVGAGAASQTAAPAPGTAAPVPSSAAAHPAPQAPARPDPAQENLQAVRVAIDQLGLAGAMSVDRSPNGSDLLLSFPAPPPAAARSRR